jgi:hypothetical protein
MMGPTGTIAPDQWGSDLGTLEIPDAGEVLYRLG